MSPRSRSIFKSIGAVVAVALSVVATQGCRSQTPAVVVNGHEVSMSVLEADLVGLLEAEAISANPEFISNGRPTPALTAEWLNVLVAQQVFVAALAEHDLQVTDEARDAAKESMDPELLKALPAKVAETLNFQTAAFTILSQALASENPGADPAADPAVVLVEERIKSASVKVDPRYGVTWDAETGNAAVVAAPQVHDGRSSIIPAIPTSPLGATRG